ncbi:MAG: galactokinase [Bacteroidota bacterium]|jgi:galactokinase|nr:galactokinase [Ignavibacteria bacterium]MCU7497853.1 galactokinase [Ignavibacteria bacterium]MCU7511134.1 galactokinase [Ignavibacteria bacterium]MCU7518681.1 galactokinase [Ignavibacteria bacterium]
MRNNNMELKELYKNNGTLEAQTFRLRNLEKYFNENFEASKPAFFTSPGRIEIGGNHTDHNNGLILASAIDTDTIAAAQKNNLNRINLISGNLKSRFSVDLGNLHIQEAEKGTTSALIRGMAAKFLLEGHMIGGFDCVLQSDVAIGSGLSSSASVEVLIGAILNEFYNAGGVSPVEIAKFGQYAENNFFGKPCGLMDQLAIAVGGIVFVDFFDKDNPKVEKLNVNFSDYGFEAVIVNTGATHADLTDDYAAIPSEMKAVAGYFGKSLCRFIKRSDILDNMKDLRIKLGDRAVLRALHFLEENERVKREVLAIKNGEITEFLSLIKQSGDSSFKFLQNIYSNKNYKEQSVSIALELTEYYLKKNFSRGSCRIHGGGFAGTILAFVEHNLFDDYMSLINRALEPGSVHKVEVREYGACRIKL